jgi:hypothetical protein
MTIYGDESGSITKYLNHDQPYFVVALVKVNDVKRMRGAFRKFVSSNLDELKWQDHGAHKMFKDGRFLELKGSQMNKKIEYKFIDFLADCSDIEVFYILVDNRDLNEDFLDNPSQTFNYVICLNFKELFSKGLIPPEECFLNLDERNEKARNVYFLENYLNTELPLEDYTDEHFHVQYFDSKDNVGVQIADVFSNILYSCLMDDKIDYTLELMKEKGILKNIFRFPQ